MIKIYCEDCVETMKNGHIPAHSVDIVLTSPPYNINASIQGQKMYDEYQDDKTDEEYIEWTTELFKKFDKAIRPNGIVLYNMSYGIAQSPIQNSWGYYCQDKLGYCRNNSVEKALGSISECFA